MAKSILIVMVLLCLFGMVPQAASSVGQAPPQAPAEDLYLVPNEQIAALPTGARIIHYYGESVLAYVPGNDKLALPVRTRITAVPRTDQLAYRSWSGNLADRAAAAVRPAGPGYYLLGLVGPTDQAWLEMLTSAGVQVLDSCSAPTVLVKADNAALLRSFELLTSEGFPIVQGVEAVPLQARIDPELLALAHSEKSVHDLPGVVKDHLNRIVVRAFGFPDQDESSVVEKVRKHAIPAAPEWAHGHKDAFLIHGPEILTVLNNVEEVGYLELVYQRELNNNLAPKDYILNIEPVWN